MLEFPSTKAILWDRTPTGSPAQLHLAYYRNPRLRVSGKVLRLVLRHLDNCRDSSFSCLLLGSFTIDEDGQGLSLVLDRFDRGHNSGENGLCPSTETPGDVLVPFQAFKSRAKVKNLKDHYTSALKCLHHRCSSKDTVDLGGFLLTRGSCSSQMVHDVVTCDVEFDVVCPSTHFLVTQINPVPIVPTALSKNLAGPMSLHHLQGEPKTGYLTMDHTRKLLLVLESDPKAYGLPLVGIWIIGVPFIYSPYVWACCQRFIFNQAIQDRVCEPPEPFLLVLYSPLHSRPEFYECTTRTGKTELDYSLYSACDRLQLPAFGYNGEVKFTEFDTSQVTNGPKIDPFTAAQEAVKQELSRKAEKDAPTSENAFVLSMEDITPRAMPSPHPTQMPIIDTMVPEVSLMFHDSDKSWVNRARPGLAGPNDQGPPHSLPVDTTAAGSRRAGMSRCGSMPNLHNPRPNFAITDAQLCYTDRFTKPHPRGATPSGQGRGVLQPGSGRRLPLPPRPAHFAQAYNPRSYGPTQRPQHCPVTNNSSVGYLRAAQPGHHSSAEHHQSHTHAPPVTSVPSVVRQPILRQCRPWSARSYTIGPLTVPHHPAPQSWDQPNPTHPQGVSYRPVVQSAQPTAQAYRQNCHQAAHPTFYPQQPSYPPHPSHVPAQPVQMRPARAVHFQPAQQYENYNVSPAPTPQLYCPRLSIPTHPAQVQSTPGSAQQYENYTSQPNRLQLPGPHPTQVQSTHSTVPLQVSSGTTCPGAGSAVQQSNVGYPVSSVNATARHLDRTVQDGTAVHQSNRTVHYSTAGLPGNSGHRVQPGNTVDSGSTVHNQGNSSIPQLVYVHQAPVSSNTVAAPSLVTPSAPGPSLHVTDQANLTDNSCRSSQDSGLSVTPDRPTSKGESTSPKSTLAANPTALTLSSLTNSPSFNSVPAEVYQLLLQQDSQLKLMQAQIQELLKGQSPKSSSASPKSSSQSCSVAINTSLCESRGNEAVLTEHESTGIQTSLLNRVMSPVKQATDTPPSKSGATTPAEVRHRGPPQLNSTARFDSGDVLMSADLTTMMNNVGLEKTDDSIQSDMIVDLPSYHSSPTRSRESRADLSESPISASMVDGTGEIEAGEPVEERSEQEQQEYYNQLMVNIQKLLQQNSGEEEEDTLQPDEECEDYHKDQGHSSFSIQEDSGSHSLSQTAPPSPTKLLGITQDADKLNSLLRFGASVGTLDTTFIPKINYVSMFLDSDSDSSMEINAMAMKYLKDEQLTQMAKLRAAACVNGAKNGRKTALLQQVLQTGAKTTPNVTQYGMSPNDMTFATKKYMQKYGLLSGSQCESSKPSPAPSPSGSLRQGQGQGSCKRPKSAQVMRTNSPCVLSPSPSCQAPPNSQQSELYESYINVISCSVRKNSYRETANQTLGSPDKLLEYRMQESLVQRTPVPSSKRTTASTARKQVPPQVPESPRDPQGKTQRQNSAAGELDPELAGKSQLEIDTILDVRRLKQLPKLL
ncbi:SCL-interrupting locus protein homolog isoform X2 [Liolophura sinensis]|uniref:SCL-interrupting locus protein homolog isoform X2 n=1 Tax=Liolophura sinensis TaxID=3198878 RepID=UPI0031599599